MSDPSRVELEPVTCWPLIFGAVGFVGLGVVGLMGFAVWTAPSPPKPVAAVVEAPRQTAPINREVVELPAAPVVRTENERIVKIKREVVDHYVPLPRMPAPAAPARPLPLPKAPFRIASRTEARTIARTSRAPLQRSENELLRHLSKEAKVLDLETEKGAGKKLLEAGKNHMAFPETARTNLTKTIRDLLASRSDLRGLPLQNEKECQSSTEAAKVLGGVSTDVRRLQARRTFPRVRRTSTSDGSPSAAARTSTSDEGVDEPLRNYLARVQSNAINAPVGVTPTVVRPLEQVFQTESSQIRGLLVETLAAIKVKEAAQALARRAVFDLSPTVRHYAVLMLKDRSLDDARPILMAALRHPWPPAADHAATTLVELNDQKALPLLEALLAQPDPRQPFQKDKKWFVRETVRVNHLRNCLLCHAPSTDPGDVVAAPIPTPGEPLPVVYYNRRRTGGDFVRADVVYFRQDFSVMHKVEKPNQWPAVQRFDYMVRTRELTAKEVAALAPPGAPGKTKDRTYPQREAVRYAIEALQKKPVEDRGR